MINERKVEIPLSKLKLILMLLGSALFVIGGILFIINPTRFESFIVRSPTIIFVSGCLSILFFGLLSYFILKKIKDKKPGLIISDLGLTDNSTALSVGFIPWIDIDSIKELRVFSQKFINIIVKNPEDYINRQKSPLKRKVSQQNYKRFGSPIEISTNGLKINYDKLFLLIKTKFEEVKISQ